MRFTKDGYLVGEVSCARTGIQTYLGSELGKPEISVVKVFRPESEVFSKDSLKTFVGKPVTDNHPPVAVDSKNWKEYSVGQIGEDILRDGERIRVPITIMDEKTVSNVRAGKREISMGYEMDLVWESGVTNDGESYDAVMKNLKMNHLAVVDKARAGRECRIGDGNLWDSVPSPTQQTYPTMDPTLKTVVVDGLSVTTTEAGERAINKLIGDNAKLKSDQAEAANQTKLALDAKDTELAKKDAEIATLKSQALDDAAIDKKIEERIAIIGDAKKIAPDLDHKGKSNDEIKKAAISDARGAEFVEGKSEAYISAAFDFAVQDADSGKGKVDPIRQLLKTTDRKTVDDADDDGQEAYENRLTDAWKNPDAAA